MNKSKLTKISIFSALILAVLFIILYFKPFGKTSVEEKYNLIPVRLKEDGKISLMDMNGKIVLEDEFSKESRVFYSEGVVIERTQDGIVKYYTIDGKKTKEISTEKYSDGLPFVNGYAVVKKENGMLALINKKGVEKISNMSVIDNYKIVRAGVLAEDLIRVKTDEGKWGYINTSGEFKIKPEFLSCENFSGGKARVTKSTGIVSIIDKSGEEIFKGKEDYAYLPLSEDLIGFAVTNTSDKRYFGFLDLKGEKVIKDNKFEDLTGTFKSGLAVVKGEESDSWGVIDKKGEVVGDLKLKFEEIPIISNDGYVIVNNAKDKKSKIFNNKGELVKTIEDYKGIYPIAPNKYLATAKDDKFVILNEEGKEITKDDFYFTSNFNFWAAINDNTEFLNNLSIESTYFDFEPLFKNVFKSVSVSGMCGISQSNNLSQVLTIWPNNAPSDGSSKSSKYVSRSDDYEKIMRSVKIDKENKGKDPLETTEEVTDSPVAVDSSAAKVVEEEYSAPQSINDNYPYLSNYSTYYSPEKRYSDGISYSISFGFNDYLKTAVTGIDPIYGSPTITGYNPNNDAKLVSISCDLNLGSINSNQFLKQLRTKLEAGGWKKQSDYDYVNSTNTNTLRISGTTIIMSFPSQAASPLYEEVIGD